MALDHAPLILWSTDIHGVITLSEGASLAGLGVSSGQLVGQNVFDLYASDQLVLSHIRRALDGEAFTHESKIGELILNTWTGPLRDESGTVVGVLGVSTEVTTRSALQAHAIQADRLHSLGTLAASIAHELKVPPVLGSEGLIGQVVLNLLVNALPSIPADEAAHAVTVPPAPTVVAVTAEPPKAPRSPTLLIIDDDPNVRSVFVRKLERAGATVRSASSGEVGLDLLLTDSTIELCFCDMMMTGITGAEVYRRAVLADPALAERIVIMSGGAFTESTRAFVDAHEALCVDKPFNIERETTDRLAALPRRALS